jgi:5-methylcytosine-specific restriction protein A
VSKRLQRPKRPCSRPGCPNLTTGRYCKEHGAEKKKEKAERYKYYDEHQRNQRARRFYKSRAWQTARQRVLIRDHYLCQGCLHENQITQADTVHHIIPIREDWSKRLRLDNLVSLCSACHNQRHSKG